MHRNMEVTFPVSILGTQLVFTKRPFPSQLALSAKILSALKNEENALLESPTGTGKVEFSDIHY